MKETALALTLIVPLLYSTLIVGSGIDLASAQFFLESITIKADGSIDPPTAPIANTGNNYKLTQNISGNITIQRNNAVLDGEGNTIRYEKHGSFALALNKVNNVTVRNLTVIGNQGINLLDSNNSLIENTSIYAYRIGESSGGHGIGAFGSCYGNRIVGNTVTNNYTYGIIFQSYFRLYDNTVTGNLVSANYIGIAISMNHVGDPSGNTIYENQVENNNIGMHFLWLGDYYSVKPNPFEMNNQIYSNNFINNSQNVVNAHIIYDPDCANIWDKSAKGNYWSDYQTKYPDASEIGNSGIGNTEYLIDTNNIDHYPLMKPAVIPELPDGTGDDGTGKTEPCPTTLIIGSAIAVVVVVAIAVVGLLAYFKKRKRTTSTNYT